MRHLVVGAGASIAQAIELYVPKELWLPTMQNFAKKTWANFAPFPFLPLFLHSKGFLTSNDADLRNVFYKLEESGEANIEEFIEFSWLNKDLIHSELDGWTHWDNFMRYGIGDPLALLINQSFMNNGVGFVDLPITRKVISRFSASDLIFSLNYDTLVEIGLQQDKRDFHYLPNAGGADSIAICKPHGSLNMAFTEDSFSFGNPTNLWPIFPTGDNRKAYVGLIPPRMNKTYAQTPMANLILQPVQDRMPKSLVMWGIGLTGSDIDLDEVYRSWARTLDFVDVINPDATVAQKVKARLKIDVRPFSSAQLWLQKEENESTWQA